MAEIAGKTRSGSRQAKRGSRRPKTSAPTDTLQIQDLAREEVRRWIDGLVARIDRCAANFHADFLRSRTRGSLKPEIRQRLRNKLQKHAKDFEALAVACEQPPDTLQPALRALRGQKQDSGPIDLRALERVALLLRQLHLAIETQRTRLEAPLDRDEEKDFWRQMKQIHSAMSRLHGHAKSCRELVQADGARASSTSAGKIIAQLDTILGAVETFLQELHSRGTSAAGGLIRVTRALEQYDEICEQASKALLAAVSHLKNEELSEQTVAEINAFRHVLAYNSTELSLTYMAVSACHFTLDPVADELAGKIRSTILESCRTTAFLSSLDSDDSGLCDRSQESDLPDYEWLSPSGREQSQFVVIIDCLLHLADSRGPDATITVKELASEVDLLAAARGVKGLGKSSVRSKLKRLNELRVVKISAARKSKENPNASDEYRLSVPAQRKYWGQAERIRNELSSI